MKKYLVKTIATATDANKRKEDRVLIYYVGKETKVGDSIDDFAWTDLKTGWKQKRFAIDYIKYAIERNEQWNRNQERGASKKGETYKPMWTHEYKIVEYEA